MARSGNSRIMNILIPILALIIIIANVTSDEIRFHWSRLFVFWIPKGSKYEKWFNPSLSWTNKRKKTKFWTFIFSTILVMFTDFWHMLKFIIISSGVSIALLLWGVTGIGEFIMWLLTAYLVWGILYEGMKGVYGALSDKKIFKIK